MRRWVLAVVCLGGLGFRWTDPAPGLFRSKEASRNLVCERTTVQRGARLRPGEVPPELGRGDFMDRSVLMCTERVLRPGLREARDEAILSTLDQRTRQIAFEALATWPEFQQHTWLVETHYPNAQVQTKLSFATKNALVSEGASVSDRTPVLSATDVEVLLRMDPDASFVAACQRYQDNGSLASGQVLLTVLVRDLRETVLHAGVCVDGGWSWLR